MPTPAISVKVKRIKRRFGISAPRVVVRSHLPWYWFAVPIVLGLSLIAAIFWVVMQKNEAGVMAFELEHLQQTTQSQRKELDLLRSTAGTSQNAVEIEKAAQQQLMLKIRDLELENSALKEDMRLFERLIPTVGEEAVVRIESFRVNHDIDSRYQYRLVLAFQPNKQNPTFSGQLQLVANYTLAGKEFELVLPEKQSTKDRFQVNLKNFLRLEGPLVLPTDAELKSVEARILQGGKLKVKQVVQP